MAQEPGTAVEYEYAGHAGYEPEVCVAFYRVTDGTAELTFRCGRPRHRSPSVHEHPLPDGARLVWPNPPAEAR
jgi:hypothetical protein